MSANVRDSAASAFTGSSALVARPTVQAGDVLIAFQSADGGSEAALSLSGGWETIASRPGGTWAGTKIYKRVAGSSEPAFYAAAQASTADGVVSIISIAGADPALITVDAADSTTTPAASPSSGSGMDLRYAAGLTQSGGSVTWAVPTGYAEREDIQSYPWTSSVLAVKAFSSSATQPAAVMAPSQVLHVAMGFTVLVGQAVDPAPESPSYQSFAPGRGEGLYTYRFVRMMDRSFLGYLDLAGVSFDKRVLQPGAFSATVPIPNMDVGDLVAQIIPRTDTVLDRGPGVISVEIYRAGQPWGEYWITGAQITRSRRGTPAIQLRGSTLDAYWSHVEIQSNLTYSAVDQVQIARNLISTLQTQYSNLSLDLQTGTSGVNRDRTYLASEGATYGQRLVELATVEGGFEWMINIVEEGGTVIRRWVWGYPRLGAGVQHVFTDSDDILEWSEEIDALRGATRWRARGGTPTSDADASTTSTPLISGVHQATAHLAAGWPRLDRTVTYPTVTVQQTLEDYAAYWAATAPGALRVDQVTVTFGANPSLTPNDLGDTARIFLNNEWHERHSRERRIIGIGITPTSRQSGKEEARLVLEGQEVV